MQRRKSTPEDDRLIKDDTADWAARASAIFNVAVDGLEYLEHDIARLLDHEWGGVRGQALGALVTFWEKDAYLPVAFQMLAEDPDEYARSDAARALKSYAKYTGRLREEILRALARAVQFDQEPFVVCQAYLGIVELVAPERCTRSIYRKLHEFDRERDVDWELLRPYLLN